MTGLDRMIIVWDKVPCLSKGAFVMDHDTGVNRWWRTVGLAVGVSLILSPGLSWGLEIGNPPSEERREPISLPDAPVRALQHNLDISISRQTKESRLADIIGEQARI